MLLDSPKLVVTLPCAAAISFCLAIYKCCGGTKCCQEKWLFYAGVLYPNQLPVFEVECVTKW